jgi:hypothetical protein
MNHAKRVVFVFPARLAWTHRSFWLPEAKL